MRQSFARSIAPAALVSALVSALFAAPALAGPGSDGGCGVCHGAERVLHESSTHHASDVTCVDCHGGDPAVFESKDLAHAQDKGYRGTLTRASAVLVCGTCHEDVRRMRPYALRTDALAAYRTSHHGKAVLEKGDDEAATCTDCHGVHDVRRVRDSLSPSNRANVPATCGRCHGDAELMKRHGLAATAPAEYARSIHGRRLADGEPGVPTCADCHDAHAAAPAGASEVADVCGNCHAEPRDRFRQSPHFAASRAGLMKQCITCHGNHAISHPEYSLFDAETDDPEREGGGTRCLACHEADGPGKQAAGIARAFGAELRAVDAAITEAEAEVARVASAGFFVNDEREALARARRGLVAAVPLTHACDMTQVDAALRRAQSLAEEALAGCAKKVRQERDRTIWGSAAAVVLLVVAGFLSLRRRAKGRV